tara:strand:+ start:3240 stop:3755 length:516 start_codon:yes stop_codon:yes gene_type:complete
MKKFFFKVLFLILFLTNNSFACGLLQVPIGSQVAAASSTFDFLDLHNSEAYGEKLSTKYVYGALEYCEGSALENTDLEVIVYDSKIAGINLISAEYDIKKEIYEFVRVNINDPGKEFDDGNYIGHKDLSIGSLVVFYSRSKTKRGIVEMLEISNKEMMDYVVGEEVLEVRG